jgi:apolipoprotein N-acyltransferase
VPDFVERLKRERAGLRLIFASPRELVAAVVLGLVSAAAFAPIGLWPGALVAAAGFLFLLRDSKPEKARFLGLVYGLTYGAATMYWFFNIFSFLALSLIALFGGYFWLFGWLIGLTHGQSVWSRAVLVAIFAVGVDWLRGDAWYLRFPWYTLPHALAASPAWIAPARWLGTYGLTAAAWFIAALGAFGRPWLWAAFAIFPACSLLLPHVPETDRTAVLIQAETGPLDSPSRGADSILPTVTCDHADLVAMPEYAYPDDVAHVLRFHPQPARLAQRLGCPVVFGAMNGSLGEPETENVAAVLGPDGELIGTFAKVRPVPLFADGKPGTRRDVFSLEQGTLGIGVCFDFDAPEVAADLTRGGATVLVCPIYDAMSWGRAQHVHHEQLLRMRAVENDRWIVRPASSGRSEAISPLGVPSAEAIEIGERGWVAVGYSHRHGFALGGQTYRLGPACAAFSLGFFVFFYLRRWFGPRAQSSSADSVDGGASASI